MTDLHPRAILESLYPRKTLEGLSQAPEFDCPRREKAKFGFTTRFVDRSVLKTLLRERVKPHAGDLVLARVKKISQHTRLQLPSGRRASLFPGDEIVVTYGNRYAPDQFEAIVPQDLSTCQLVAAGGIAAKALTWHSRLKSATTLEPLGLVGDARGVPVNLRDFRQVPQPPGQAVRSQHGAVTDIPSVAVLGTSMNAGKTTTAAFLIRGLCRAGLRIGAIKVTGTGAGNDLWLMQDAGAEVVLDFTNAGYPSTYKVPAVEIERIFLDLLHAVKNTGVDCVVIEIADGLFHKETATLVQSECFQAHVGGVLFCSGDAMGAAAGVDWLEQNGIPVLAVSGAMTASKLARNEAQHATRLDVLTKDVLSDPGIIEIIGSGLQRSDLSRSRK